MTFNEDSKVKIPALIHLSKLGYEYIPRSDIDKQNIETSCNILKIFF